MHPNFQRADSLSRDAIGAAHYGSKNMRREQAIIDVQILNQSITGGIQNIIERARSITSCQSRRSALGSSIIGDTPDQLLIMQNIESITSTRHVA